MPLPVRKLPRMKGFDYSAPANYFVTICTYEKKCIFGQAGSPNQWGIMVQEEIVRLHSHFSSVVIEKYVVMPNHVHVLLTLNECNQHTLSNIIGSFKSGVSRRIHQQNPEIRIWQTSFHDHVIRSRADWENIWNYIERNPEKWNEDCFYQP